MIEKSIYEDYQIDFSDTYTSDDAYYFIFNNERKMYLKSDNTIPTEMITDEVDFKLYIGKYKGKDASFDCGGKKPWLNRNGKPRQYVDLTTKNINAPGKIIRVTPPQ